MKSIRCIVIVLLLSVGMQAQGIKFENALTWEQVKEKARKEKKFIFLDIFATWCVPCKMMEKEVYSNDTVGSYFADHFISVKVQMDQTKSDNAYIKSWYATADSLRKAYNITAYPTLIFLSMDGDIVFKSVGYSSANEFYNIGLKASDPKENYTNYTELFNRFDSNTLPLKQYASLAIAAQKIGNTVYANKIAKAYKALYLDTLNIEKIQFKEHLDFIVTFYNTIRSNDNFFKFFYEHPIIADSILQSNGTARSITNYVITKEEVIKYTGEKEDTEQESNNNTDAEEPDWNKLNNLIGTKYDYATASELIQNAKFRWYKYKKDWPNYVKVAIEIGERIIVTDTSFMGKISVNSIAYSIIFKYGTSASDLKKGVQWMEFLLKSYPERYSWIDTYANLLYKLKRVKKAIALEQKAVDFVKAKGTKEELPEYVECLNKMKEGKPTW